MKFDEVVKGPRLLLRPLTIEDTEPGYLAWMKDPEVVKYLESRFAEPTLGDLRSYVELVVADPATYFFAIVLSDTNRHIGNIKLGPIDAHHRRGDIGILLGERAVWGLGYATEAIELLCSFAFDVLDLHKVTAGAYSSNQASIRAFLRVGFEIEGCTAQQYSSEGLWADGVVMGRLQPY